MIMEDPRWRKINDALAEDQHAYRPEHNQADDWHEITENKDGSFTATEPGVYGVTIDGTRTPIVRVRADLTHTQVRELPKDAPIGPPEKWVAMNRAERRKARRNQR